MKTILLTAICFGPGTFYSPLRHELIGIYPNPWWSKEATPQRVNAVINRLAQGGVFTIRNDGVVVQANGVFAKGYSYLSMSGLNSRREAIAYLRRVMGEIGEHK